MEESVEVDIVVLFEPGDESGAADAVDEEGDAPLEVAEEVVEVGDGVFGADEALAAFV